MGLVEDINELKELLKSKDQTKVVEKKWKFPFGKKVGAGQKKKNFVTTLALYENGTYEFKKYKIEDQTIIHEMIPRLATAGHVMFDTKGNPLVILPNWSLEPFSPLEHQKQSMINGNNTNGFKVLMARMEKEQIKPSGSMGGWVKWVVGLGLAAIIGYALISGGK